MKRLIAACSSMIERNTPRLSRRRVSVAKNVSTAFSHEPEVGVNWTHEARVAGEPGADLGALVGSVVVEDHVDHLAGRDRALDRIREADELLVPVAGHAAPDQGALEDVQGGKQGGVVPWRL
jgi:hypothetical protein